MHFVDATKPWKSQQGFKCCYKERRCLQPSEGTQTPSGRRFGGESQETPPKNELSALKNVSLPYIHMENSDLRWEICLCAEHRFVDLTRGKAQTFRSVLGKHFCAQILGLFQKVWGQPSSFLDGNHIFDTKMHQNPNSGLIPAFAAVPGHR